MGGGGRGAISERKEIGIKFKTVRDDKEFEIQHLNTKAFQWYLPIKGLTIE